MVSLATIPSRVCPQHSQLLTARPLPNGTCRGRHKSSICRASTATSACLFGSSQLRLPTDGMGHPVAIAADGAEMHVDQSVLTVIAADTDYGLQVRTRREQRQSAPTCMFPNEVYLRVLRRLTIHSPVGDALSASSAWALHLPKPLAARLRSSQATS